MAMTRMAGIDPGSSASAALVVDGRVEDAIDVPFIEDALGKRADVLALCRKLEAWHPRTVTIERVWAMPSRPDADGDRRGMGVSSAFQFGTGFGDLRTTIVLCGFVPIFVVPITWKAFHHLKAPKGSSQDEVKEASRQFALRLHPEAEPWLRRKRDHGRAEAILIADYGVAHLVKQDREAGELAAQPGLFGGGRA